MMAYDSPDEILFGFSRYPLRYGLGLEVGSGEVIPEIKYIPKADRTTSLERLKAAYVEITRHVLERAADLGVESVQLETEFLEPMTWNPEWGGEIVRAQKEVMEQFYEEWGIKSALRATIADIRRLERGVWDSKEWDLILRSFESAASAGADLLSIESRGGQDFFNYAFLRGDWPGIIFSLSVLAVRDMERLWREIVSISRSGDSSLPAGDTACAFANTAMVLAGGLAKRRYSHVASAVIRAISAVRSLVAYEVGATGPGKDCGYENAILKVITGKPMSMEGKGAAFAHSSLVGNLVGWMCDLWSNEQVEQEGVFSGSSVQAIFEVLTYDARLMNTAIRLGQARGLRDALVASDKYVDPQGLVLSPEGAFKIAEAIAGESNPYLQAKSAAEAALELIEAHTRDLSLPEREVKMLSKIRDEIDSLPDSESSITELALERLSAKVPGFDPRRYEL